MAVKTLMRNAQAIHCIQLMPEEPLQLICGSHEPHNGDEILTINGKTATELDHDGVVALLRSCEHVLHMTVRSRAQGSSNSLASSTGSSFNLAASAGTPEDPMALTPDVHTLSPVLEATDDLFQEPNHTHPPKALQHAFLRPVAPSRAEKPMPAGARAPSDPNSASSLAESASFVLAGDIPQPECAALQLELNRLGILRTCVSTYRDGHHEHAFHILRSADHPMYLLGITRAIAFLSSLGWLLTARGEGSQRASPLAPVQLALTRDARAASPAASK
jgi:hypothetical protein